MSVEIIKNNEEIQLTNTKLRNYTEQIYKQGLNIKKAFARVATILVKIDDSKCYEQDGFESVHDYALQVVGWKHATTSAMLRIGREYIDGKTLESVLPHVAGNDYSNSQLQALLPLKSVDTAKTLAEREIISPEMTVKEIKKIVKDYKAGSNVSEGEATNTEIGEDSDDNANEDVIDAKGWSIKHSFEIMESNDGSISFMLDGEESTKEELIKIIESF